MAHEDQSRTALRFIRHGAPGRAVGALATLAGKCRPTEVPKVTPLHGDAATSVAAQSAAWACAVVISCDDPDTLTELLNGETRKTVRLAAARNPHLPAALAAELLDEYISAGHIDEARAIVSNPALPLATAVQHPHFNECLIGYPVGMLDRGRFTDRDVTPDTLDSCPTGVLASAFIATRCDGTSVNTEPARADLAAAVARHPKRAEALAAAFTTARWSTGCVLTPEDLVDVIDAAVEAFTVIETKSAPHRTRHKDGMVSFDDDAKLMLWVHAAATLRPEHFVEATKSLPPRCDVAAALVEANPAATPLAYSVLVYADATDPHRAELASVLARNWDADLCGDVPFEVLRAEKLCDDDVVEVLRRSASPLMANYLSGFSSVNPPKAEVVAELVADPGRSVRGTDGATHQHLCQAWTMVEQPKFPTDQMEPFARLIPGVLGVHASHKLREAGYMALVATLTEQLGDDPSVWTLAVQLAPGFTGTVVELVDLIAATA